MSPSGDLRYFFAAGPLGIFIVPQHDAPLSKISSDPGGVELSQAGVRSRRWGGSKRSCFQWR
jgi:hypothetical protein